MTAKIGVVQSSQLTTKTLLPRDYLDPDNNTSRTVCVLDPSLPTIEWNWTARHSVMVGEIYEDKHVTIVALMMLKHGGSGAEAQLLISIAQDVVLLDAIVRRDTAAGFLKHVQLTAARVLWSWWKGRGEKTTPRVCCF